MHYQRFKKGQDMSAVPRNERTDIERFSTQYTVAENGCWNWNHPQENGRANTFLLGKVMSAYRASYLMFRGHIPDGLLVCHSCDNGRCVNPAHLWIGTYLDNNRDAISKGRARWTRGEARGKSAKLTEAQVREIKLSIAEGTSNGNRLAKKFGVNRRTVYDIIDGKTWAHVTL